MQPAPQARALLILDPEHQRFRSMLHGPSGLICPLVALCRWSRGLMEFCT